MKRIVILFSAVFLSLLLTSCKDDDGYLAMPENYLGYWKPRSSGLAGFGLDVQPDVIWSRQDPEYHKDIAPEDLYTSYRKDYKVFYIDDAPNSKLTDQYVYAIVKIQYQLDWVMQDFDMAENGTPEEQQKQRDMLDRIMTPYYQYYGFSIGTQSYEKNWRYLRVEIYDCNLEAADWDAPAFVHYQRFIEGDSCRRSSVSTWYIDITTDRP